MGWSNGSYVMQEIIAGVVEEVREHDERKRLYIHIINALENADWDTQDECVGIDSAFDEALEELHSDWDDEV